MTVTVVDAGRRKVSRSAQVQASAAELFELVADPRRHAELDGSGTVQATAEGPRRLAPDAKFSVRMKMLGVPYRITSRVTEFEDGRLVVWRHPSGHYWRWEFTPSAADSTLVTETFDYSQLSPVKAGALELLGFPKQNGAGIEATLRQLQARYAGG